MQFIQKSPKSVLCIITFFSILINASISECPRETPILKGGECQSVYCTEKEFSSKTCEISNEFIKIQWFNKFHTFQEKYMSHISVVENNKGELFLTAHKGSDDYDKYIIAFNSEGEGLFYNQEEKKNNCFEVINFNAREYADYNNYIEINDKGYLIGSPTDDDIYLIDYVNKKTSQMSVYPESKSSDTIFQLNNFQNTYFTAYIIYKSYNYYLHFLKFKLSQPKYGTNDKIQKIQNITMIPTKQNTKINCNQNDNGYILCFYSKVEENILNFYLSVINSETFQFEDTLLIENNCEDNKAFDETINLRNDLYILGHSIEKEYIKLEFKQISLIENSGKMKINYKDYFSDIQQIFINKDKKFKIKNGIFRKNDLYKINENKFALFIKEYSKESDSSSTNRNLLIYIFTIFNNDKNISVRRYSINFELYKKYGYDDVRGFRLGNFLGIITGLFDPSSTSTSSTATYMIFGYVNTTEPEGIDGKLKYGNADSKIVISQYINEIENNLFGYTFLGAKILSLPAEADSGYFIYNITNNKIKKDDIVSRESELRFVLNNNFKVGTYEIQFQVVVKEPEYEYMNVICEEVLQYPEGNNVNEKDFYEPKLIFGKKLTYKFRLSNCYDSCEKCTSISEDENNQKCITCREGYYFKEDTQNCYDKIESKFYFDKDKKIFRACHENCLTCSSKPNGPNEMNCLTCDIGFKFYNKSNNCLYCPKYVNPEQNECMSTIPDNYFLEDKNLGSLGKCHFMCRTCNGAPYSEVKYSKTYYYQNCKSCLYNQYVDSKNCSYKYATTDPDFPKYGECPMDKPIIKDRKCSSIYCTDSEYKFETCIIYNQIIKDQWLNKTHIFSELPTSSISIADDTIENQKIILFAQNMNREKGFIEKYMYGFYKNGTGIFYNKNKNSFESFKKIDFTENGKLIDKISYIEMNNNGYLLTTPIENNLYLIDYIDNKITKKEIDTPAYSTDKIIFMKKEDTTSNSHYLSSYINCKDNTNDCYLMMKKFKTDKTQLTEDFSMKENIKVYYNSQLNCYKDEENYLRCSYTKYVDNSIYKHVLGIFSSESFNLMKEFDLENEYDDNPTFDSMIRFTNNVCVIAYSKGKNIIKILIKKIIFESAENSFSINDYIQSIPEILLNEDNSYLFEGADASSNSLLRISDEKFALFVNDFKVNVIDDLNSRLIIFILNIYNSNSKINVKHYLIDFTLYNGLINKKVIGYNLNDFLGILVELTSPDNLDLNKASFFTFGYVNTTDVEPLEGNAIIVNDQKIKLENYYKPIENNIFGYIMTQSKVISVPDEKDAGFFGYSTYSYGKYTKDKYVDNNKEFSFYISDNPKKGNYSIVFAPILKEPDYKYMNSSYIKVETYPKGQTNNENSYSNYKQKELQGKYFTFNFYLDGYECYQNCETCYKESKDENDQQCKECKIDFIKVNGTNNCISNKTNSEEDGNKGDESKEDGNKGDDSKEDGNKEGGNKGSDNYKGDGVQTDGNNGKKGGAQNLNLNLFVILALYLILL